MEELIEQLTEKVNSCGINTKSERMLRGAYVDALVIAKEALNIHLVSNRTSAKDIKMYRKQGRMSGAIKREPFYKLVAKKFDEDYCDYDFTLLYDC